MFPCASVVDQRWPQNAERILVTHALNDSCATFFLPHFDVICIHKLLLNRRTATWNLFYIVTWELHQVTYVTKRELNKQKNYSRRPITRLEKCTKNLSPVCSSKFVTKAAIPVSTRTWLINTSSSPVVSYKLRFNEGFLYDISTCEKNNKKIVNYPFSSSPRIPKITVHEKNIESKWG